MRSAAHHTLMSVSLNAGGGRLGIGARSTAGDKGHFVVVVLMLGLGLGLVVVVAMVTLTTYRIIRLV